MHHNTTSVVAINYDWSDDNVFGIQVISIYWHHMTSEILVNTGSGIGLFAHATKPLTEPTITFHYVLALIWE